MVTEVGRAACSGQVWGWLGHVPFRRPLESQYLPLSDANNVHLQIRGFENCHPSIGSNTTQVLSVIPGVGLGPMEAQKKVPAPKRCGGVAREDLFTLQRRHRVEAHGTGARARGS